MVKITLSSLLKERHWTREDLAQKTGIDISIIRGLAEGTPRHIDLRHLDAICKALNCGIGDLMVSVPGEDAHMRQ